MAVWDDRDPALAWALSNAMSEERALVAHARAPRGEDQDAEDEGPEDAGAGEEGGTHGKG